MEAMNAMIRSAVVVHGILKSFVNTINLGRRLSYLGRTYDIFASSGDDTGMAG